MLRQARTVGAVGKTHFTCGSRLLSCLPTGDQPAAVSPRPCIMMTVAVCSSLALMTVGSGYLNLSADMLLPAALTAAACTPAPETTGEVALNVSASCQYREERTCGFVQESGRAPKAEPLQRRATEARPSTERKPSELTRLC